MIIKIQNKANEKANNQSRHFTNKALERPKSTCSVWENTNQNHDAAPWNG